MILRARKVRHLMSGAFILLVGLMLVVGFIYWQTVGYLTRQIDQSLLADARSISLDRRDVARQRLDEALARERREGKVFGIFAPDGIRLSGNIIQQPRDLPPSGRPVTMTIGYERDGQPTSGAVRLVVEHLTTGETLVLARRSPVLDEVAEIVTQALVLAAVPALLLTALGGLAMWRTSLRRVEAVRRACEVIMRGHLDQRLPVRGGDDEIELLSVIVNEMLDEIERLLGEVRGAGEAIAHDLRTPLTRMRARLARTIRSVPADAHVCDDLQNSLGDIDQALSTITAILRISEVEQGRRQENFTAIDLADVAATLVEFYGPIAEENGLSFTLVEVAAPRVRGDADLIFEAVANLVDNAIKFTPAGGHIWLKVGGEPDGGWVHVEDTGPGIPACERDNVLRRFHRLDGSRHRPGNGLGLSLVAAICGLHRASLALSDREGGGCRVTIRMMTASRLGERAVGLEGSFSTM